jgi:hypothetical protein
MKMEPEMRIRVRIIGVINDHKFTVAGGGHADAESGEAEIQLKYSSCPPDWSPMNYSDPLALLPCYCEREGGLNLMSLSGGSFSAEATYDFGAGHSLRKTARVQVRGDLIDAVYSIVGTVHADNITRVIPYEEHMHPAGKGQAIGIGLASWESASGMITALVSTRYHFDSGEQMLTQPQTRRFEADAEVSRDGLVYTARYQTDVVPLVC